MSNKAHKHAAMIKAKADNMDLVVFCKDSYDNTNKWQETSQLPIQEEFDYFLCLPDRNEECLHWLNGSDVEFRRESGDWQGEREQYHGWANYCGMMNPDVEFRIKPRKEKRWVAVRKSDKYVESKLFIDAIDANKHGCNNIHWDYHEIEVEL